MDAYDAVAQEWRDRLLAQVATLSGDDPTPALLLSGGADSGTILAALLVLKRRPECYTFRLGDHDHTDTSVTRAMCARFGLRLVVVSIPRTDLLSDVRGLLADLGVARKTAIQCAHPVRYLAEAVAADGHETAFVGTGGIIEDNRRGAIILHTEGEEAFRAYRRANLASSSGANGPNGTWAMHEIARLRGVRLLEPYAADPFAGYALSLDAAEINRPVQKGIAYRAFWSFWTSGRWRRHNDPMNVGSDIRRWHDTLLASPVNTRGRRSIAALYGDLLAADGLGARPRDERDAA